MAFTLPRIGIKHNAQSTPYDVIIRTCLWLAVFFVPFFFLPLTTDPLEMNKALLFYLLVLVGGIAWLMKLVLRREGGFLRTPFDVFLAIFLLFSILATIFSLSHYQSVVGLSGYYSGSLVSLLFFLFFFFLFVNNVRREQLATFLNIFLLSGAVIVLLNFLQVFSWYVFPWDFTKIVTFNAVTNSPTAFSVLLAVLVCLCTFRFLSVVRKDGRHPLERGLIAILGIMSIFVMMVYDQPFGWIALVIGLLVSIVLLTATSQRYAPLALVLPTVLIGLSLVGLFVNTQSLLQAKISGDLLLPQRTGWTIAQSSLKASPLVGFGQETFQATLARFRPLSLNNASVWNLRFLKSSNEWFQQLSSIGLLGTLAFFVVVILYVRLLFQAALKTPPEDPQWWLRMSILAAGFLFVLLLFVLPSSFLTSFFLWVFLAAGVVNWREKDPQTTNRVARKTGTSFAASLGFSLAVVLGIVFLYFAGRFWIADVQVQRADVAVANKEDLKNVQALYANAISLNPYEQSTYFSLAQDLFTQAQLEAQKKDPNIEHIRTLIAASTAAGQSGVGKFTQYAGSYEALSQLYQSIDTLTGSPSDAAKEAFQKAIDLDPNNPQVFMNLGQYYFSVAKIKSDQASAQQKDGAPDAQLTKDAQSAIISAQHAFENASKKKDNYIDAQLNVALALRLAGDGAKAVQMLEDLAAKNPFSTDALFNLAENYLVDKRSADAEVVFLRVVSIYPGYSDAQYRLGQIYEDRGETAKAIARFEIVQKLNPDNATVREELKKLRAK
ncbi:MAG: tetratricopeptide repeat protein [bacterium]